MTYTACPLRKLTWIAKTFILTLQSYELTPIFANNSKDIFSFHIKFVILHLHLPLAAGMSSEGDGADGGMYKPYAIISQQMFDAEVGSLYTDALP